MTLLSPPELDDVKTAIHLADQVAEAFHKVHLKHLSDGNMRLTQEAIDAAILLLRGVAAETLVDAWLGDGPKP